MDYVMQAVSCNSCAALLLITLLMNHRRKYGAQNRESRLFTGMIVTNLLQCIVEPATIAMDGRLFPGAVALATAANGFLYLNNIIFALQWFLYAEAKIHPHGKRRSAWACGKYLPAAAVMVGAGVNLFTPVFFRITPENVYQRQAPFLLAYLATYFYLILGSVTIFLHRQQKQRSLFLPALSFLFPVGLASVVQFLVPGISLLWSGSAIGLASAYMNIQDESVFTDEVSGLFSRHYLNLYLSALPERGKDAPMILGILLDVDDFKQINDSFGHLVGDDAIASVGSILRAAVPENGFAFRFAGDEFVMLQPIQEPSGAEPVLQRIRRETEQFNAFAGKPYRLQFSTGVATYKPGESPSAFLERMDARMYENKRNNKGNRINGNPYYTESH